MWGNGHARINFVFTLSAHVLSIALGDELWSFAHKAWFQQIQFAKTWSYGHITTCEMSTKNMNLDTALDGFDFCASCATTTGGASYITRWLATKDKPLPLAHTAEGPRLTEYSANTARCIYTFTQISLQPLQSSIYIVRLRQKVRKHLKVIHTAVCSYKQVTDRKTDSTSAQVQDNYKLPYEGQFRTCICNIHPTLQSANASKLRYWHSHHSA